MLLSRVSLVGVGLLALACGHEDKSFSSPCSRSELEGCGLTCSTTQACPAGLFCSAGKCDAECTAQTAASDCSAGQTCGSDGRCTASASSLDGGAGDANTSEGDGATAQSDTGFTEEPNVCGSVVLDSEPVIPNVFLIIDQSSSMDDKFGSSTRWKALKDSLLSDTGLIKELDQVVRFGAVFYSGREGEATCPLLSQVDLAIGNYETIKSHYPDNTIADTPTGDAIEAVLAEIPEEVSLDPVYGEGPTIFVLATDGEPDRCEELNPQHGQQEAIDAVKHAYARGIRTYIIAVADEVGQKHVNDIANAGVGNVDGPQAPSYRANDDQGLRDALRAIIGGEVSCDVPLKGKVTGDPCAGTIKVGGNALTCNDPNGYSLMSETVIRVNGTACDAVKQGKLLSAEFPCGAAVPLL
jgi:hypothetical protein